MTAATSLALTLAASLSVASAAPADGPDRAFLAPDFKVNPYDRQVDRQISRLKSAAPALRAGAAEALGFLRAYRAAGALAAALGDQAPRVRREAAMALAWCGGRPAVAPLLKALDDDDWVVRQAADVALGNLTGMELPYDALGRAPLRAAQADARRKWWAGVNSGAAAPDVLTLAAGQDRHGRLRAVRALGALGGRGAAEAVRAVLAPYRRMNHSRLDQLDRHIAQSCIRSVGRLGGPGALEVLLDYLTTAGWGRYAADALGDLGDPRGAGPLISAYPQFARDLSNRRGRNRGQRPRLCPVDDRCSGDNTQDRMYETPYAIIVALSRLGVEAGGDAAALRALTPLLMANLTSDWDSGVFYEIEAYQLVTAHLLERAGLRQAAIGAAFGAAGRSDRWLGIKPDDLTGTGEGKTPAECFDILAMRMYGDVPYMGRWLPALCRGPRDVPKLIELLEHDNGWVRINAAKALMFIGDARAVEPLARGLKGSHPEAEYGFSGVLEHAEYDDPAPRWREAFVRALGRLGARRHAGMLAGILHDPRNVLEIQFAAAMALDEMGWPEALAALRRAEAAHPFHSIRLAAREALWRRGLHRAKDAIPPTPLPAPTRLEKPADGALEPQAIVFIKGTRRVRSDFNGQAGVDPWRQTYVITNSGPTMRLGHNLCILRPATGKVTQLTHFTDGYVADCEVSWDGETIVFARRLNGDKRNYRQARYVPARLKPAGEARLGGPDDPWWHIWQINADGTGLRQLTRGPYHDVAPAYLPDGRIVFSSSRLGLRDEYHGFPAIGLTVMNADGGDIHVIGFNFGADRDPAVLSDGRIVFSRLDIFYSRLKTEVTLQTVFPDGTRNDGLYGPERRAFWKTVHRDNAAWTMRPGYRGDPDNRNRVLRLAQPQPLGGDGRVVCATSGGLTIAGPGRYKETLVPHDRKWAVTSPFPLGGNKVLCSATVKQFKVGKKLITAGTEEFKRLRKGPALFNKAVNIDLGLYVVDVVTGKMTLLYNDPAAADFEARPIVPRRRPPALADSIPARGTSYSARLVCGSARLSRVARVSSRGRFIRVIEGQPVVARHETQKNRPTNRWKNHGATIARVLGTAPLAADGAFHVEVPADRLLQMQVLDADRRVLGNQVFWMYARAGEIRSCTGCHEDRNAAMTPRHVFPKVVKVAPVRMLPTTGGEFSYRAKSWFKGRLGDEIEARTRTVRAVNLIGRQ